MAVAGVRYGFMKQPWDAPLGLGVQGFIEYNGLVINDRYQSDRIWVQSITGIDGPDVTDIREVVPGDDGEFAYQTLYRGRTLVITGVIQAGSIATSTKMAQALRAAYSPLVESPMTFRWFNIFDGFDAADTLGNYTAVVGSSSLSSLTVSGSTLRWGTSNPVILMRSTDNHLWGDVQVTERVLTGAANDNSQISLILSYVDPNNYLAVTFSNASQVGGISETLNITAVVAGTAHALGGPNIFTLLNPGSTFWLRGKKEGDLVTAELWLTEPTDDSFPDYTDFVWLSGSDADMFGDQVLSEVGFGADTANNNWAFDDFHVEALYPCDVTFDVKPITKPSISEAQAKFTKFERSFQLTLRASRPYARGSTQRRSLTLIPTAGNTTSLGFGDPISDPLTSSSIGGVTLENDILSIQNRGTSPERPTLVVYGAATGFTIYNLINGMQMSWSGTLPDGEYLVFDCLNRTLVDSNGTNQQAFLTISDPRWMLLDPDWNDLYFTGMSYSANTRMVAFYNDRFI